MSREAFEVWASQFDTESNEYIDKGADEFFSAGYEYRQPEIDALKAERDAHRDNAQQLVEENAALKAEVENLHNKLIDAILARQERDAEAERLRKDAERLNALDRGGIELRMQYEREEEDLFLVFRITGFPNDLEYVEIGRGVTVREAIDAAMKETK